MSNRERKKEGPSAPRPAERPVPKYEPPAVAWEEPFDPLANCDSNPAEPGCDTGPIP